MRASQRRRGHVPSRSHPPLPRVVPRRTTRRRPRPLRAAVAALLTGALGLAALAGGGVAAAAPGAPTSAGSSGTSGGTDYTRLVDPFVSTAGDDGNDLPGAEAPHSLAKV